MPAARNSARLPLAVSALALLAAAALAWWWSLGRPKAMPDGPEGQVECISYAPFRKIGESPFNAGVRVPEARILEDLRILAARTSCVRTYSVQQGLSAVPRIARQLGLKVLLGVWIGRNRAENDAELGIAIPLARDYSDVVRAVIVGNEVLLRRELAEADLRAYIERAASSVPVPVTYADVWEFWLEHPALAGSVTFLTIHNLPYWEDQPVGVDQAVIHVLETVRRVSERLPGKDILIGETGWPSAGRSRRDAVPGRIEQAQFVRQMARAAAAAGQRYNLIEGFDQPWKRRMEGGMGGAWGLFDSDGAAKFPWRGPVEEVPGWQVGWIAAAVGALMFGLWAGLRRRGALGVLAGALAGAATGAAMAAHGRHMLVWNRDVIEWSVTVAYGGLAIVLAGLAADRLSRAVVADAASRWMANLRLAFLFGGAVMTLLLVFDARYRGFPSPLYAVPAAAGVLLAIAGERLLTATAQERFLALVILLGAPLIIASERLSNVEALFFEALLLLMAGAATGYRYGLDLLRMPIRLSAASSTPTADGS